MREAKTFWVVITSILTILVGLLLVPFITSSQDAMDWSNINGAIEYLTSRNYVVGAPGGFTAGRVPYVNGSGVLTDEAGFEYNATTNTFSAPTITATTLNAPTGRTATYVIAASDAPAGIKAQADYVCDGTADNVEIQAAIDALPTYVTGDKRGGVVHLSIGNFYISSSISMKQYATLEGEGWRATTIRAANALNADMIKFTSPQYTSAIRWIGFVGNSAGQASGWCLTANGVSSLTLDDCAFNDGKDGNIRVITAAESITFRNVLSSNSPYGFYLTQNWIQLYDCVATTCSTASFYIKGNHISLVNCVADEAIGTDTRQQAFFITNSNDISLYHCQAFGDPTTPYLLRGFRLYYTVARTYNNVHFIDCKVSNVKLVPGFNTGAFAIESTDAGVIIKGIKLTNCVHEGLGFEGLQFSVTGTIPNCVIEGCYFSDATKPVVTQNVATTRGLGVQYINNVDLIASGEVRTYCIPITAGGAGTKTAWQNPNLQDCMVVNVSVRLTTGDADAANGDCGVVANATTVGTNIFADLTCETAGVYYSYTAAGGGTQTLPLVLNAAGGADDYITFTLSDNDGTSVVGYIYITLVGV